MEWGKMNLTRLTLDLLASPAGGILSSLGELLVGTCLASHGSEPIATEILADLAVGESLGDITATAVSMHNILKLFLINLPEYTHARPQQCLSPVRIVVYALQELED